MNKKHKSYHFGEINKFFHYVGGGSFIALLLGYFLLDKIVNTGTRFFLCWTCVGILTVIVGIYFRIISGLGGVVTFVYMVATPLILVVIVVQSLFITYLFTTYQPSPDQMSRIYTLSWVLVLAVIHTIWALSEINDNNKNIHPLYGPISKFFGTDVSEFSALVLNFIHPQHHCHMDHHSSPSRRKGKREHHGCQHQILFPMDWDEHTNAHHEYRPCQHYQPYP